MTVQTLHAAEPDHHRKDGVSNICFPLPIQLPPLTPEQKLSLLAEQSDFERRFSPMRHRGDDILIVSWAEIQRQYLDLCAPWDRSDPAIMIQVAQQNASFESAEKTLRTLFVMNHMRTSIDTPWPRTKRMANQSL